MAVLTAPATAPTGERTTSAAAVAFGGTTCHVDFCIQSSGQSFGDALAAWHAKREGKAIIDNGYHIAVTDLREGGSLEELASLPEQGVTSYKLFMAYKGALMVDDETLFRVMEVTRKIRTSSSRSPAAASIASGRRLRWITNIFLWTWYSGRPLGETCFVASGIASRSSSRTPIVATKVTLPRFGPDA